MSKTLDALIASCPEMTFGPHREYTGLRMRGTKDQIESLHNLLSNFTHQRLGGMPHEPKVQWITRADYGPGLAFIAVSMDNIRRAIKTYLYVNILLAKEVADTSFWDENEDEYIIDRDELGADKMATEESHAFVARIGAEAEIAA